MRNFVLHMKKGNLLIIEADAIAEAERQEKSGISPTYSWRDNRTGRLMTAPWVACLVNLCGRLRGRLSQIRRENDTCHGLAR